MILPNTSQLFMLLLNIYFNLTMLNPYISNTDFLSLSQLSAKVTGLPFQRDSSPEGKIDRLMHEYIKILHEIKNTKNDEKALILMAAARKNFIHKANEIKPELKKWLASLPSKQVALFQEKMMLKPYFKDINDITIAYTIHNNVDKKPELKQSLNSLNDFMNMLYN